MMFAARVSHLRVRDGHAHHRVTYVELFFDLVFVFAITQLSHGLLDCLTLLGTLQIGLLMVAVWWRGSIPRGSPTGSTRNGRRYGYCFSC
jgi:low temperature requirement protein LtrA